MNNTSQFNKTGDRKHLALNQGIGFGLSTYQEPWALPEQSSALEGEVKGRGWGVNALASCVGEMRERNHYPGK